MGPGAGRGRGMGPGSGRGQWGPMPAVAAEVEPIDGGARLELDTGDQDAVARLRRHARWHQQRMQSGQCWHWSEQQDPQRED